MLTCNVKGCTTNNFPLHIQATFQRQESEFNQSFVVHMLSKLDFAAIQSACKDLGLEAPAEIPSNAATDNGFLRALHDIVVDVHIQEGKMICPNCSRQYPITNGVANMLLTEEEC